MNRNSSPDAVELASERLDRRLVACADDVRRRPSQRMLTHPWVIAGIVAAFIVLPRRYKKPVLKAAWPIALGLLKAR